MVERPTLICGFCQLANQRFIIGGKTVKFQVRISQNMLRKVQEWWNCWARLKST